MTCISDSYSPYFIYLKSSSCDPNIPTSFWGGGFLLSQLNDLLLGHVTHFVLPLKVLCFGVNKFSTAIYTAGSADLALDAGRSELLFEDTCVCYGVWNEAAAAAAAAGGGGLVFPKSFMHVTTTAAAGAAATAALQLCSLGLISRCT